MARRHIWKRAFNNYYYNGIRLIRTFWYYPDYPGVHNKRALRINVKDKCFIDTKTQAQSVKSNKTLFNVLANVYWYLMEIIRNGTWIEIQVYRKPSNTGLLLHFQNHTDNRYKDCLLKTMIHRAHALSSTSETFNK